MKYFAAVLIVFVSLFAYYFWYHQDADFTLLFHDKFGRQPCSVLGGKVVWITGASSGIGEYLAYELAQCGCKLVLSARRKHELERVRDACASIAAAKHPSFKKEKDLLVLPLDLAEFATHAELTSQVVQHFGQIDVLVNNGGVAQISYIEKNPFEVEKKVLDINLLGTISLTKAVLPHMLKREQGQIVSVSSVYGLYGVPGFAAYCSSKFALLGYFNTLRLETANKNIKVLNVLPGDITTDVIPNSLTDKPGVRYKDMPYFKAELQADNFPDEMTAERCARIMSVAMANDMKEVWPSNQPVLARAYMAQYMPSFYLWYSENVQEQPSFPGQRR